MNKVIIGLVITIVFLSIMVVMQTRGITELNREIVSKQNTIDSLHDELFISNVALGRYELTLDHLQEVKPDVALEFVNFMNHETE